MITIILCHPWDGSFNQGIFERITECLNNTKREYQVIDLYKDNFNPVLTSAELVLYAKGEFIDPLVGQYQTMLKKSDQVIFIFPIWWMSMPAMLKGFFDKVMLVNFAWYYDTKVFRLKPLLNIQKTLVVTTSEEPTDWIITEKDGINGQILNCMTAVGFYHAKWLNCPRVSLCSDNRKAFLQQVMAEL